MDSTINCSANTYQEKEILDPQANREIEFYHFALVLRVGNFTQAS
jgi:hypothetical protein